MGFLGKIFGGEQAGQNPGEVTVNPEGGIDLLNNVTSGSESPATNSAMSESVATDPIMAQSSFSGGVEGSMENLPASPAAAEVSVPSDVDADEVAANVNQQLASAGIELSGQVVVQTVEAEPTVENTEASAGIETNLSAMSSPEAIDVAAQPSDGLPENS